MPEKGAGHFREKSRYAGRALVVNATTAQVARAAGLKKQASGISSRQLFVSYIQTKATSQCPRNFLV